MGLDRNNTILETRGIVKQFPKVLANKDISITLKQGEILSLLGENGAGKSTLMNILYGLYKPTSGSILLKGKEVEFSSPKDAIDMGLGMVHQHFMLVGPLTVTENIILGAEPGKYNVIDYKTARKDVEEISRKYGLKVDPDEKIENLSVGLQQRVEILKALYRNAKVLILDEPTAVLTPQEVDELFGVVRELHKDGVSIIIITHKLEEVMAISNRVYVLRGGELVGERVTKEVHKEELANLMVGRDVVLRVEKEKKEIGDKVVFSADNIEVLNDKGYPAVNGLSLDVKAGEIVAIAGVDGNGQSELAEGIMGLRRVSKGEIQHLGEDITHFSTGSLIERSISFVPSDRHRHGLILGMKVSDNTMIGYHDREPFCKWGFHLDYRAIRSHSEKLVKDYDIRTASTEVPAAQLSGGNQQKVILARELSREPTFLLVSQPTRGLDVGAIEYIQRQVLAMREREVGILLISLELEEVFALADRILVLYEGKIVKEFVPEETDHKEVGYYMTGGTRE
ncbi:MAG: ABC transporter ATP-binding protein [Spirochaetaceae bacterium]